MSEMARDVLFFVVLFDFKFVFFSFFMYSSFFTFSLHLKGHPLQKDGI